MTTQRRQRWIVLLLVILLLVVSWTVVGIIDGITHPSESHASSTPAIERMRTP